ncbi:hypothetical protein Tco_1069506 [Tanacetum coccineum]|uniref:Uncharacterized protein n=1 Tax=Tanacetum coccineum TaxID=301880 RepID=A0ABQ5HJ11_9ASTR
MLHLRSPPPGSEQEISPRVTVTPGRLFNTAIHGEASAWMRSYMSSMWVSRCVDILQEYNSTKLGNFILRGLTNGNHLMGGMVGYS